MKKSSQLSKSQKQKLKLDMNDLNTTFDRLSQSNRNLIQFQCYFSTLSLLCILGALSNFYQIQANNLKIFIYAVVAIILDLIKKIKRIYSNFDPLGIETKTTIFGIFDYLLQINGLYLLARILYQTPAYKSIFVVIHFLIAFYRNINSKPSKSSKHDHYTSVSQSVHSQQKFSYFKLQAILLFICCKIIYSQINETSIIFLILSASNLLLFAEVANILFGGELFLRFLYDTKDAPVPNNKYAINNMNLGSSQSLQSQTQHQLPKVKRTHIKVKRSLVKNMLLGLSVLIVIQNVFMIVQSLRYQMSITLIQSLGMGFYIIKEYYKILKSEYN